MVSLQSPLSPDRRKPSPDSENSLQKRKWEDPFDYREQVFEKRYKAEGQNFMAGIELHLETPLPSEWQRCLDIQSGKIHFYNTKTRTRTSRDPRSATTTPQPAISPSDHHDHHHMSLDLELNLTTSDSPRKNRATDGHFSKLNSSTTLSDLSIVTTNKQKKNSCPSWLAFEADQQEMVATVCMRCHMLVMLCRSSPACPNCKFMHPPEKSPSTNFIQVKL
ncbi:hypothetical protein L484_003395 [Morus notabilis]|uniref:WW domain-containing protein n=1 Tax=Morus notabilis TaxID=981085 RepID=W9RXW2_9ROSA|nr:uncharacterized protein LOC21386934 [Morus notabilis]EXB97551.1 hypothetical protein L484_003395 [Morus notabilis]